MARKRILLIDDDQVGLESLRERLEQAGYETITATDGRQGLALAQSQSLDLILMDWLLPGLDGFQICSSLKEDPRYAHIPIVMLTDIFATQEDMQQGLQAGAERHLFKSDYFVSKPLVYDRLLRDIGALLDEETPSLAAAEDLILVVEADGVNRTSLERALSDAGYAVVAVAGGKEGWAQFKASVPALVLLGVEMPGLKGLEMLQRIRDQTPDVAVIVMMTCDSGEVVAESFKRGADDCLIKPFQPWQALRVVKENLEKIRLRRLNQQLVNCLRDSNLRLLEKHRALHAQNTELQEAYRRLQDAEQMRRESLGMVVHDLKNPLNVLLISLDVLVTDFGEVLSEEQREILRSANIAGQQMLHLITNMLEVQRLEDGKIPVRLKSVDLVLALRMIVHQTQPLADRKDIVLLLQVSDPLPLIRADLDLTSRVVANLLDNAIKFTPPEGQVSVTVEAGEDEVVVCVADSGPGISADQQAYIFEKFAQVDLGPRRGKGSVGLGLAFCRLAVEAQGGRVWVDSEPGQGSQFKFALPVWREDSVPVEAGQGV